MASGGPRGSLGGLLAVIGQCCLTLYLAQLVASASQLLAVWWSGTVYCLAFSMGVLQLVFVLWGNSRALHAVRFDRRLEHPPGADGSDGQ